MERKVRGITDLYQAAYFFLNGCTLLEIECNTVGRSVSCTFHFDAPSEMIYALEDRWFSHQASVGDIREFRLAHDRLMSRMIQVKRDFAAQQRAEQKIGGRT